MKFNSFCVGDTENGEVYRLREGLGLVGYVQTSIDRLLNYLGPGLGPSPDGKARMEWTIQFADGMVVSIYDWKSSGPIEEVEIWNIAGEGIKVLERVREVLNLQGTAVQIWPK